VEKLFLSESTEIVLYVLIGLWFSITATSIFFCVRCFIPKIEGNYDNNVLFFGDVINKYGSIKEFSKTFYEISQDEEVIFQQMGEQIYINSKIAAWKFSNVAWAIRLLGIGLLLLLGILFYFVVITI
jgi:hypothetical protein